MKVISVINQKGGVGKTTVALNLSAYLVQAEQKVLLIDLDPQGHSTLGCGLNKKSLQLSLFSLMDQKSLKQTALEEVVRPIHSNLHLIPSNITLTQFEPLMHGEKNREYVLRNLIKNTQDYDFVIIDAPPSLGLLTINALLASQCVIVPLELSPLAFDGAEALGDTLEMLQERLNHQVLIKYVVNRFQTNSKLNRELFQQLKIQRGDKLFPIAIPQTIRFVENLKEGDLFRLKRLGPKVQEAFQLIVSQLMEWRVKEPRLTPTLLRQTYFETMETKSSIDQK